MLPATASAHAKFFVDDAGAFSWEQALSRPALVACILGASVGIAAWTASSVLSEPHRPRCIVRWACDQLAALSSLSSAVPVIARLALGGALIGCAALGRIATPGIEAPAGSAAILAAAVLVGGALVVGVHVRLAAVASVTLLGVAAAVAGSPVALLERLDMVALAAFVVVVGGRSLEPRMDAETVDLLARGSLLLRVGVATALVVVAFTEKLGAPQVTVQLLEAHPRVDVGALVGLEPLATVLAMGAVEIALAMLVLLMPIPEVMAPAIGVPFVLTIAEFGILEVPGHLPVYGAMLILAILGSHPQTGDLLTARVPGLRVQRTPAAARARIVGEREPWAAPREDAPAPAAAALAALPLTAAPPAPAPQHRAPVAGGGGIAVGSAEPGRPFPMGTATAAWRRVPEGEPAPRAAWLPTPGPALTAPGRPATADARPPAQLPRFAWSDTAPE